MRGAAALAILLAFAGGCTDPVTEIVLEVDSDLSVPGELSRLEITVTSPDAPGGEPRVAEADLEGEGEGLPRTLTLVHRNGALGPWPVRIAGHDGATEVVATDLRLTFEEGESLRLRVMLSGACAALPPCDAGQTCADGRCRSSEVQPCEYEGRGCGDGGVPDDGATRDACLPTDEICNRLDDDCDGSIDEDFDLETDPLHCGRCDRACPMDAEGSAGSTCEEGACVLDCDPGLGDCDRDAANGCETDTDTTMEHCGTCGAFCPTSGTFHASDAVCSAGRCLLSCDDDWGDCDDDRSTGCETHVSVDRNHCGTCDNPCPDGQMCRGGSCL